MPDYTSFEVGQKFPLPIRAAGDGALFQVDANGMMFILRLSHTDVIAHEAFRTGEMEFAFYEEDGVLFLLYRIDGIFKDGWGDAPLSLATLAAEQLPTEKSLHDPTLHLYLVDGTLDILLAQRTVTLGDACTALIKKSVAAEREAARSEADFTAAVQRIWAAKSPAEMREAASAIESVPLALKPIPKPTH